MLPKLIGLYSSAQGSGKSTVAGVLEHGFGYKVVKFAAPLYEMWFALCLSARLPSGFASKAAYGDMKETPLAQLGGLSFRAFANGVGTLWGRQQFSETLWVDIARQTFASRLEKGDLLVVDDMRFPNEYDMVKKLGGTVVKVVRPRWNGGIEPKLESEGNLDGKPFDMVFANERGVESLCHKVRDWAMVCRDSVKLLPAPWMSEDEIPA